MSETLLGKEDKFATQLSGMCKGLLEASKYLNGDSSCPGFHQCVDRSFEGGKFDCEECKEDALNAMEAGRRGG